jgi:hypothetical protein
VSLPDVIADLEWIMAYWPDLIRARLPLGTAHPWRQPELTPTARARRDAEAHAERFERNPLGADSPAPLDVAILQTALDVLVDADDLAARVAAHAGIPELLPPRMGDLDAWPYLAYTAAHLTDDDEDLLVYAAAMARSMYERTANALGMIYDGQTLAVTCPWCGGRTPETPVGGAHTWRVMLMPGDLVGIVCTGQCNPPADQVGTWWYGQPCWPLSSWESLARRVQAARAEVP